MQRPDQPSRRRSVVAAVTATAVALAVGELVAGLARAMRSPVEAVADAVIEDSPASVTKFGIETFGKNDKLALVIGILVTLAIVGVIVGLLARRRRWVVPAAFAVFGAVGVSASLRGEPLVAGVPALFAAGAGIGAALLLFRLAETETDSSAADTQDDDRSSALLDRRGFVLGSAAFVAAAGAAAAGGRALRSRFSAAKSRAALMLPSARQPLAAPPAAASFDVDGLAPLYTPNDNFYRIDTALTVPQVPAEDWTLRVKGMVDREFEVTFDEFLDLGLVEADITLTCVSNPVGGELVGNARWLGVPLRVVLDEAGVDPNADQIVGRSVDGYTCGFPVEAAYDRDALIAVGMNGEPLPLQHGFPARLITPGLYGYISATKWLEEIELTRFDRFQQYWVPRGYAERAPVKQMSRIDVPRSGNIIEPGPTVIAGVAWAQTRGISKVEVQIDDDDFVEAELAEALNDDTWRQWRLDWDATEGNHRLTVRSTDGDGRVQTDERAELLPDGASGWQSRLVTVRAA